MCLAAHYRLFANGMQKHPFIDEKGKLIAKQF
jgi:hypothetical protein